MSSDFANKNIAVVGLGRSGLACAEVLTKVGARVRIYDSKPADQIAAGIAEAAEFGVDVHAGNAPIDTSWADIVVTSPGVPVSSPQLRNAVAAGVPVIGEIEAAYRIAKAPIVAITGTNGKTTTTVLVGEMLRAVGRKAYVGGNIAAGDIALPLIKAAYETNGPIAPNSGGFGPMDRSPISSPSRFGRGAEERGGVGSPVIVAEISSFQLEWIDTFRPRVGAILNITPDHGDRQTWDEYVAAKWRMFENQTADDLAVMNDDLAADRRAASVRARIQRFGPSEAVDIVESVLPIPEVKLPGRHNIENLSAAILMAREFGVDDDAIREVARNFGGVVHRLETVATVDGVRYINNSMCTNPDAFAKSLAALPEPKVVIMGGVFKGDDPSPLADAVVANSVRGVVLIGKSAPMLRDAFSTAGYTNIQDAGTLAGAVAVARGLARPGDTVILAPACASFDMFKDFEDRGDQFKQAVRLLGETA
jgi:UDP-N-acetylmuramoylalanine--D-glutamate ligase